MTDDRGRALRTGALRVRHLAESDHAAVLASLDDWWGGFGGAAGSRERALLLPRLFFQHFTDTSWVAESEDGQLTAFLIGFMSPAQPSVAYVHFVGVDPHRRRAGLASDLYRSFFTLARSRGADTVRCVTSPGNRASIEFHRRLGFTLDVSTTGDGIAHDDAAVDVEAVRRDYDGPGVDRVVLTYRLDAKVQ